MTRILKSFTKVLDVKTTKETCNGIDRNIIIKKLTLCIHFKK